MVGYSAVSSIPMPVRSFEFSILSLVCTGISREQVLSIIYVTGYQAIKHLFFSTMNFINKKQRIGNQKSFVGSHSHLGVKIGIYIIQTKSSFSQRKLT